MVLLKLALLITLVFSIPAASAAVPKGDDFGSIVKMIEQFYRVKHEGVPFLAKAGIKTVSTAARIRGGKYRQLAEAGSVKVAIFENQQFETGGEFTRFRATLNQELKDTWMPLVQTLSATDKEQCYVFLRDAGEKFHVLVVTIEEHDATVVQVTVSPRNLMLLLKDPDGMGKSITDEATTADQE
jgi:hypothetical protein